MIGTLRSMWACHWSARRIQRYLDAARGLPLTADEVRRLEQHLAVCERCSAVANEHRMLRLIAGRWASRTVPDQDAVQRLHLVLNRIVAEDRP